MKQTCKRPAGSRPDNMIDTWGCTGCEEYKWTNPNGSINHRLELFEKGYKIFTGIQSSLTEFYEEMTKSGEIDRKGQANLLPHFSLIKHCARDLTSVFIVNRQIDNEKLPESTATEFNDDLEYEILKLTLDLNFHKISSEEYFEKVKELK